MTTHLDETDQPCTRHPSPTPGNMLALALLGSRMPSFHHDVASKLQSLMMAVDELTELAQSSEMQLAANSAMTAVRDLTTLFSTNRALAKSPQRRPTPVGELLARAAERSGVKTRGELPTCQVEIALPSITHACAVILDLAAGPLSLGRTVEITGAIVEKTLVITVAGPPGAPLPNNAGDVLALASFALERETGQLRCTPDQYVIKLPLAG
ncbi:MAG TPA: hypothetical protein VGC41_12325 [Kofleriaceae bacterium]